MIQLGRAESLKILYKRLRYHLIIKRPTVTNVIEIKVRLKEN